MDPEQLAEIKEGLVTQAAEGLALYNKAQGALELLAFFLTELEDEDDGIGNGSDSGRPASDENDAGDGNNTDSSGQSIADSDENADG